MYETEVEVRGGLPSQSGRPVTYTDHQFPQWLREHDPSVGGQFALLSPYCPPTGCEVLEGLRRNVTKSLLAESCLGEGTKQHRTLM